MSRVRSILYPETGLVTQWAELPRAALPPAILDVLPDDSSGYPISQALGRLLAQLVLAGGVRNILEFGAGSSSVVFAEALRLKGGGSLTSIEQSPQWCHDQWELVTRTGVDAQLKQALPEFRFAPWPCHYYRAAEQTVRTRGPYDLVLVDAPQWYYGRDGAMPLASASLRPGALIVVDDAGRSQERWAIRRWLQTYPGLRLIAFDPHFGRNGVAILRAGAPTSRRSAQALVSGLVHTAVGWVVRRVRGLEAETSHTVNGSIHA